MFFDPKMLLRFGEYLIEREHDSDVLNNGSNRPHMPLKQNYLCAIHNARSPCAAPARDTTLINIISTNLEPNFIFDSYSNRILSKNIRCALAYRYKQQFTTTELSSRSIVATLLQLNRDNRKSRC